MNGVHYIGTTDDHGQRCRFRKQYSDQQFKALLLRCGGYLPRQFWAWHLQDGENTDNSARAEALVSQPVVVCEEVEDCEPLIVRAAIQQHKTRLRSARRAFQAVLVDLGDMYRTAPEPELEMDVPGDWAKRRVAEVCIQALITPELLEAYLDECAQKERDRQRIDSGAEYEAAMLHNLHPHRPRNGPIP